MFRVFFLAASMLVGAVSVGQEIYTGELVDRRRLGLAHKPGSEEPFSGIWRQWHKNLRDGYRTESTYKDGLLDGPSWRWYSNGQLELEINYKDGHPQGVERWWYENGQPRRQTAINKDGREEGLVRQWYANGQLKGEGNFKHGYPEGLVRTWHENGQLNEEECFANYELVAMYNCETNAP